MQNNQAKSLERFSQEQLEINKKEMKKIMAQAPIAGIYLNQDPSQWVNFFNFYLSFLKLEIGPRGECSKAVRVQMSQKPQFYDDSLSILGMTHKSHIRDIYVKYKQFSPCKEYDELIKLRQALMKSEESYKKIMDQESVMYREIKDGMLKKRGEQFDYKKEIQDVRIKYKTKIDTLKQNQNNLLSFLEKDQRYLNYIKLRDNMMQYFQMWRNADAKVGYESVTKGDSFQKIVSMHLLPLLLKRSKIPQDGKYSVETNCRWYPKTLGEIDIAIITFNQTTLLWEASVLIECKSRLFDIKQAYKQVNDYRQKGKQKLCTKLGIINLAEKPEYFIITTLPENPFHLPIESKLKEGLQKAGKNKSVEELTAEQVLPRVKAMFEKQKSPLEWFIENDSDRIIVLRY